MSDSESEPPEVPKFIAELKKARIELLEQTVEHELQKIYLQRVLDEGEELVQRASENLEKLHLKLDAEPEQETPSGETTEQKKMLLKSFSETIPLVKKELDNILDSQIKLQTETDGLYHRYVYIVDLQERYSSEYFEAESSDTVETN